MEATANGRGLHRCPAARIATSGHSRGTSRTTNTGVTRPDPRSFFQMTRFVRAWKHVHAGGARIGGRKVPADQSRPVECKRRTHSRRVMFLPRLIGDSPAKHGVGTAWASVELSCRGPDAVGRRPPQHHPLDRLRSTGAVPGTSARHRPSRNYSTSTGSSELEGDMTRYMSTVFDLNDERSTKA
jgi:hypothetical protein